MSETNAVKALKVSEARPKLKKTDFIKAVPVEPIDSQKFLDLLAIEFNFIGSYGAYMIDHFEGNGKLKVNSDGTIQRVHGGSLAGPRTVYFIIQNNDDTYEMATREVPAGTEIDKAAGESVSKRKATRYAISEIYKKYLSDCTAIKELAFEPKNDLKAATG